MELLKNNWFKVLAVILLFWALADNPYGYYQFLRWAITIIAGYSGYMAYKKQRMGWAWIFGIMGVLFNPVVPFYLSRNTWQFIDITSAIIFLISMFKLKVQG